MWFAGVNDKSSTMMDVQESTVDYKHLTSNLNIVVSKEEIDESDNLRFSDSDDGFEGTVNIGTKFNEFKDALDTIDEYGKLHSLFIFNKT